ncbi:MAG: ABC transporter ATP-binding protein [Chlorobium sp.]|nr:MAG: ABC transporter ATP-binding protein [Chlorobium sp.]
MNSQFYQSIKSIANKTVNIIRSITRIRHAVQLVWQCSRTWMAASLVVTVLQGMLPFALIFFLKVLIDRLATGVRSSNPSILLDSTVFLVIIIALLSLFETGIKSLGLIVTRHLARLVTDKVTETIHAKSILVDLECFENPAYFDLLHRTQREAHYRPVNIVNSLMNFLQNSIILISLSGLLVIFEWTIPFILAFSAIPGFMVQLVFSQRIYRQKHKQTQIERKAAYLSYILTGEEHAMEVRLLEIGSFFKKLYDEYRKRVRSENLKLLIKQHSTDFASQIPSISAVFIVLVYIIRKTLLGLVTIGSLVMCFQAFQRGLTALKEALGSLASLYEDSLFLSDYELFLAIEQKIGKPSTSNAFPAKISKGINFDQVTFRYPGSSTCAIDNVSFTIKPGEHVALVGENGAGKTTIVKLLCRLYDPTEGSILIDGINIRNFNVADLRRNLAVLLQNYARYQTTVRENIHYGDIESQHEHKRIMQAASFSGADKIAEKLPRGYETQLGRLFEEGTELSTGQWQKIALARTFLKEAPLIILDEPTSSLDIQSEHNLFDHFLRITKGQTAIIISHRFSTIRMVDRILVLENGSIIESGSHEELMQKDSHYAKLYNLQSSHYER